MTDMRLWFPNWTQFSFTAVIPWSGLLDLAQDVAALSLPLRLAGLF
jgi:hypothetical protein